MRLTKNGLHWTFHFGYMDVVLSPLYLGLGAFLRLWRTGKFADMHLQIFLPGVWIVIYLRDYD